MLAIIAALVPIFLLITLGLGLRVLDFPGRAFWPLAERITYFLLFPALLLKELAGASIGIEALPMAAALVLGLLLMSLLLLALRPWLRTDGPAFTSIFQGAIRFNTFVGLAAVQALFGADGVRLFAVAIAAAVPLINVLCVAVLARFAQAHGTGLRQQLRLLAQNPLILACLGGIALSVSGVGLPPVLAPALDVLGRASVALGLLAVGAALDLAAARRAGGQVLLAAALKLLLLPAVTTLACWLLQVDGAARSVAILWATLPAATSAYILARQMGGDAPLAAAAITLSTILASVTMPLVLVLAN